jgi:outer membrane receptor protein involved in Fe transport
LGLNGAVTLERSRVNTFQPGLSSHERLLNQPDVDANIQATYSKGTESLALTYEFRGAYVAQYGVLGASSALDAWVRGAERLNFVASYHAACQLSVSFSITNILNDIGYHATIGQHAETIPSLVYSGRTYVLTTKWVY